MKKLLLILLCLPMIGFGQGWVQNFYFSNFSDWEVGSVEEINGSEYIFFVDNGFIKTDGQGNVTSTFNIPINPNKKLEKVVDILGRETKGKTNEPLFYIYDDGSVEKRITIE